MSWKEPDNTGPAITGYDRTVPQRQQRQLHKTYARAPRAREPPRTIAPEDDSSTTDVDERLTPGASYEVSVRARSIEGPGEWSDAGTGRTSAGNHEPKFGDRSSLTEENPTTKRTVAENTRAGQSVGSAVSASDGNGDKRTYKLVAADAPNATDFNKFDINESTGQILTKDPLNHEGHCLRLR